MSQMFDSSIRSAGDMAGVFEFDGEAGYFYLYRVDEIDGNKVLDAIQISVGQPRYGEGDLEIGWSSDESLVFLRIGSQICAVFDCRNSQKYGGNYMPGSTSNIPPSILSQL